jgi:hypothetical protein
MASELSSGLRVKLLCDSPFINLNINERLMFRSRFIGTLTVSPFRCLAFPQYYLLSPFVLAGNIVK